jgi:hypothetical protein
MSQVLTTVVLADTLFDDRDGDRRELNNLVLPLLLCGSMGAAQQTSGGTPPTAQPGGSPPAMTTDTNCTWQTLLMLTLLRGRGRD